MFHIFLYLLCINIYVPGRIGGPRQAIPAKIYIYIYIYMYRYVYAGCSYYYYQ